MIGKFNFLENEWNFNSITTASWPQTHSRLVFYGQNLKNEVENICGRNAYSEDRYRDLFGLIDDCAQQLIPLQALETKYENAVSQLNSLKRPIEASCSDDGKKARLQSETQNGEDLEVTSMFNVCLMFSKSQIICFSFV